MSYLRNVWYMAAREQEIEGDALLERRLLDRPYHGPAAIQRALGASTQGAAFWDLKPVILSIDASAIRARRRLMKLLREEAAL